MLLTAEMLLFASQGRADKGHSPDPAKPDAVRRYFPTDVPELHEAHLPLQTGRSSQKPLCRRKRA